MSTFMSTSKSNYTDMSIWKKHADHSTTLYTSFKLVLECKQVDKNNLKIIFEKSKFWKKEKQFYKTNKHFWNSEN